MTDASPTDPPLHAPPSQLGSYRILKRLGEGGMGTVYLAQDEELNRPVAIKWLRHSTPATIKRLKQEAQLHARVEHPAVCRIYAVAEHEAWPYLVMQYIDGQTLDQAALTMNLETKLRLMVALADGVHAAHQQGLIHRDIKPSNLMVERDETGTWRPYVMDFGLARDTALSIHSEVGLLLGSPAYMAPEQIEGGWVDPRADVYGLGASLFEILTGRPPFLGSTTTEILLKVQNEEAPALRSLRPEYSQDLETILQTCLAKEPSRRYPSAAALRNDLQRILDGDPVKARPVSFSEKSLRWMRRNRLTTVLAATICVTLLGTGLYWIRARHQSQAQTYWAQRFGQNLVQMEDILRFGRMLPPHDLSPEFEQVRQSMEQVRSQMRQDSNSVGPGHFALGEGHLILEQYESAKTELETAWHSGYRAPEVSLAQGRCCLGLYNEALQEILGVQDAKTRIERQAQLRKEFLGPGLAHFQRARQALGGLPKREEMLYAMAENRYEDAVALAQSLHQAEPWRYETLWQQALALTQRGRQEADTGQIPKARATFEAALNILDQAQRIAPSDDRIFDNQADIWYSGDGLKLKGLDRKNSLEKSLSANEQSLVLNNHLLPRFAKQGTILTWLGKLAHYQHEPSDQLFQRAEIALRKGLSMPEHGFEVLPEKSRAEAYEQLLSLLAFRSEQIEMEAPLLREILKPGLRIYAKACTEGLAGATIHGRGGTLFYIQASLYPNESLEGFHIWEKSLESFQKAEALRTNYSNLRSILMVLRHLAYWKLVHGEDPSPYLAQSKEALRKARGLPLDITEITSVGPGPVVGNDSMAGYISHYEAAWADMQHKDCMPFLNEAQTSFEKALENLKRSPDPWDSDATYGLAMVHITKAENLLSQHKDPSAEARRGIFYAQQTLIRMNKQPTPAFSKQEVRTFIAIAKSLLHKRS